MLVTYATITPKLQTDAIKYEQQLGEKFNLHHRGGDEKQHETEKESPTRVVLFVKRLRSTTARSRAPTAAEAQANKRHEQGSDDGHNGDDDDEPILFEYFVVLVLLHVRPQARFHFFDNDVT
jgi:hypothetical protein